MDLRLELRNRIADVRMTIDELPDLLQRSRKSRDHVLSAMGTLRTGAHEQWKDAWASDLATAETLSKELPIADENYLQATHQELESKLLEVHVLGQTAARLRDKYIAELASDNRDREHIQTAARDRVRFRTGQ